MKSGDKTFSFIRKVITFNSTHGEMHLYCRGEKKNKKIKGSPISSIPAFYILD